MDRDVEEMLLVDIPDTVLKSIMESIAHYTIGFLRIERGYRGNNLILLGSGTLVTVNGIHAILTAHHVIEVLPDNGELGLVYSARRNYLTITAESLRYLKIDRGPIDAEGPDLGAVILPPSLVADLRAVKSFHNLDLRRMEQLTGPPAVSKGLWIVQGFIAERTIEELDFERRVKTVRFFELSSSGGAYQYATSAYDYFRVPIEYKSHGSIPESYGGTSGGGLWHVALMKGRSGGEIAHAVPVLSAFYQEAIDAQRSALKCHGRRSVYEIAYEAIRTTGN